jgi:hypothetical protein
VDIDLHRRKKTALTGQAASLRGFFHTTELTFSFIQGKTRGCRSGSGHSAIAAHAFCLQNVPDAGDP